MNEIENIIFKSDLNGNITPGNSNTWKTDMNYYMWTQNNINNNAYTAFMMNSQMFLRLLEKAITSVYGSGTMSFHPVIEYSE